MRVVVNQGLTKKNADALFPDDANLLLRIAQNYFVGENHLSFRRYLLHRSRDSVVFSAPTQAEQHLLLARIYTELQEFRLAKSNFELAISMQPQCTEWHAEYAEFLRAIKKPANHDRILPQLQEVDFDPVFQRERIVRLV